MGAIRSDLADGHVIDKDRLTTKRPSAPDPLRIAGCWFQIGDTNGFRDLPPSAHLSDPRVLRSYGRGECASCTGAGP
jgi:hypothetical protein